MEIKEMKMEDIEARKLEITSMLDNPENIDIDALENEVNELEARANEIKEQAEKRNSLSTKIANGMAGKIVEKDIKKENTAMEIRELRNRPEYLDAYVENLKGNKEEMRALLTDFALNENVGENDTTLNVPTYIAEVSGKIWEDDKLLSRIRKVYLKGVLTEDVVISGTDAVEHEEGSAAVADEQLAVATVQVIAHMFKKTITITDELYSMRGQAFVDYLFAEFGGKIRQALQNYVLKMILASTAGGPMAQNAVWRGTDTAQKAIGADDVLTAWSSLGDDADDPIVVMSKATYAKYRALRASTGQRLEDVFEGLEVVVVNSIDALAQEIYQGGYGEGYGEPVIVGDFRGIIGNYPNGEEIQFVFDNITMAAEDKVRITGKVYAGFEIDRKNHFAVIRTPLGE